jgi:DNA-binding transcriptional ArsR family regulator
MSDAKPVLEVSSEQIYQKLVEIEERIAALETVATLAHQTEIEEYVRLVVAQSEDRKAILRACEEPRTNVSLQEICGKNSRQAVHRHLKPLHDGQLVHSRKEGADLLYEWSPLMRRLNKGRRQRLLDS